ncbi:MAG: hypothetical protein HOO10_07120 [Candidatus Marinimicrobia bacterium]|jgi:polyhydroxyalkanoate synthesis regulator phasin|nr:hypothetical protein [Candidatus Neomarinimicrobiota bacterium]
MGKGYEVITSDELIKEIDSTKESLNWLTTENLIDVKSVLIGTIKMLSDDISKLSKDAISSGKLSGYNKKRFHKQIIDKTDQITKAVEAIERIEQ